MAGHGLLRALAMNEFSQKDSLMRLRLRDMRGFVRVMAGKRLGLGWWTL